METCFTNDDAAVRYVVEGSDHGLFEIRIHRLNHKNDLSTHSFKIKGLKMDDL